MILLCGILTGIGIFLVVLKQEKLPEQKPEKVKQELQKKSEETLEDPKQKPEETEPEKEAEEQAEEPLSMELSGLNEEALSMMGISKREVADALRTWTQEHGFPVPQEHSSWSRCWYDFQKKNTAWIASFFLQMEAMESSRRMYKPS